MAANSKQGINVLWVAESNFASKTGIKTHTHNYFHLFLVREGEAVFRVGEEERNLKKGEAILVPPNQLHGMADVNVPMVRCYEVKFTVSSPRYAHLLTNVPAYLAADIFVESLVSQLVHEGDIGDALSLDISANYLITLINYLFRCYGHSADPDTSIVNTLGFSSLAKQIIHYLENNFATDIPLQTIADKIGLNKNYMCSAFKRDTGMTIGNCLTFIRIRKAAEFISFSDMSLQQVAEATGFTNLSHFNRIFKKIAGIPPGQYRRMFPASILVVGDEELAKTSVAMNGFIASVLGGKKMTSEDLAVYLESVQQSGERDDEN